MQEKIKSHKDLKVWQKALKLSLKTYEITESFPDTEKFGLTSQIRRSAVSIPSNIAEGKNRGTKQDYRQFLRIARGSLAEYETQIEISFKLKLLDQTDYKNISTYIMEIGKMLNAIIKKLGSPST